MAALVAPPRHGGPMGDIGQILDGQAVRFAAQQDPRAGLAEGQGSGSQSSGGQGSGSQGHQAAATALP